MDFHTRTQRLWQHTCCQTRYWSAARLCDRCGAHATSVVVGVSTADAMAHLHFLEQPPVDTKATPPAEATVDVPGRATVSPCEHVPRGARSVSDPGSHIAQSRRIRQGNEEKYIASRRAASLDPVLERALLSGVWLLSGFVCTSMAVGAFVEFERANYVRSFTYAISALAVPITVIAWAIEGWLKHYRSKKTKGHVDGLAYTDATPCLVNGGPAMNGSRSLKTLLLHPLWNHQCCGDRYWDALERCDRCGSPGKPLVFRVSFEEAMVLRHAGETGWTGPLTRPWAARPVLRRR